MTLSEWMFLHKVSGKDLAERLGVSAAMVSCIRSGKKRCPLLIALRIEEESDQWVPLESWPLPSQGKRRAEWHTHMEAPWRARKRARR